MTRCRRISLLALLITAMALALLPQAAHAQQFDIDQCAPGFEPWDYTPKVVACIENSVEQATGKMLGALSDYMVRTVAAIMTLAMCIFGIRIIGGEHELLPRAVGFLLRMGIVLMFSYSLGSQVYNFPASVFYVEEELISIVGGGPPWYHIDNFLGNLLGFGPSVVMFNGILGLVGAAVFSSIGSPALGVAMFMPGVMAIFNLVMFIFDLVFIYLKAIVVIAFLLIISPLIVPAAFFFYTERYVRKWIDMLIGVMITPMLLFAFLYMFIGIFDTLTGNIFTTLGGNDLSAYWKMNNPVYSWLQPYDPNTAQQEQQMLADAPNSGGAGEIQNIPAVQSTITPFLNKAFNSNVANVPGIDFGANSMGVIGGLMTDFIALWIFASIMKTMIRRIPEIAASIASVMTSISMDSRSIKHRFNEAMQNMRFGAGVPAGGMLGGEAGATVAGKAGGNVNLGRQLGGMVGGVIGAITGK